MSAIWPYWRKMDEPEAGLFKIKMITGYDVDGDPENRKVLYVCESMEGFLSEAFSQEDINKTWAMAHLDREKHITSAIRDAFHNSDDFSDATVDACVTAALGAITETIDPEDPEDDGPGSASL